MSEPKTKKHDASVEDFLSAVEHDTRRADGFTLLEMMREVTGEEPAMWGPSIIGFGSYHYKYESGREGDMPIVGFSPRKRSQSVYIMDGFEGYQDLLDRLGKHRTGKSCLYINKLADVDTDVLREIIRQSFEQVKTSGR
jgi:hypothetical protein